MCVLSWTGASAGDGGGPAGKQLTGDDVKATEVVVPRRVSTGVNLERDTIFELTSGEGVAETSVCLALTSVDGPVKNLLESLSNKKKIAEKYD